MPNFSTATATAVSIAQSLLLAEKDKGPITANLITEKVNIAAVVVAPGNEHSIDTAAAISELIRRFSLWIGQDTAMADITGHEAWLGAARKKIGATGPDTKTCSNAACRPRRSMP